MSLATAKSNATAAWALDEASGTRADSVGSNDLTDVNTVGVATGQFGNGADFEASNSERLTVSDSPALSMGDIDFCIACWVRPESTGQKWILAKGNTGGAASIEYAVNLDTLTQVRLVIGAGDAVNFGQLTATGFGALSAGQWYLIVVKHDAANNEIGISINGGAYETTSYSLGSHNNAQALAIGDLLASSAFAPFDGVIDDVVIIKNYLLTDDDIDELWNGGTGVAFADWDSGGGPSTAIKDMISGFIPFAR